MQKPKTLQKSLMMVMAIQKILLFFRRMDRSGLYTEYKQGHSNAPPF